MKYDNIMTKKKQPIFIDIDGCITTGKNRSIPWRYVKALQDALKKYQYFYEYIIVTARPAPYAEAVIQFLGLMDTENHKHAICESGAVFHLFGSDTFSTSPKINIDTLTNFEKDLNWLQEVYGFNIEDGRKRTMCVIAKKDQQLENLANILKEYIPKGINMHVSAGGIDLVPKEINKAVAVKKIIKKINKDINSSIFIGDSGSDMPLLKIIGHPACPANAGEKVKKIVKNRGGYIAQKEFSLGVVEILKHYYKKY